MPCVVKGIPNKEKTTQPPFNRSRVNQGDMEADVYSLSAALIDRHYAVNVRAAILLCAEFAKRHDGRSGGRIINLSSGQGVTPLPDNLPYAATKGVVEALTLSMT